MGFILGPKFGDSLSLQVHILPNSSLAGKSPWGSNKSLIASHWRWHCIIHLLLNQWLGRGSGWSCYPGLRPTSTSEAKSGASTPNVWTTNGGEVVPQKEGWLLLPKGVEWSTEAAMSTYYYFNLPFRDKGSRAQRQEAVCPRSHMQKVQNGKLCGLGCKANKGTSAGPNWTRTSVSPLFLIQ